MSVYEEYLNDSLSRLRTVLDDSGTRPILFVGSGISRRYLKSPDWVGLLEKMIEINPKIEMPIGYYAQNANNDYPKVGSALIDDYHKYAWEVYKSDIFMPQLYQQSYQKSIFFKYKIGEYLDDLMNQFSLDGHDYQEEIELIKQLNPHAIITTNYDALLESLFPHFNVIIGQQVIKRKEATNIGHILKIHGSSDKPSEIVISSEDYEEFHQKQKYLIAKLITYFIEHPVIFFGYSLQDSNVKSILSDISEIVTGNPDDIVNNLWFIEWNKDVMDTAYKPPVDKIVDLGYGKSIRLNYILVDSFNEVFTNLYQETNVEINKLRDLQNNIYNIVKSKTIADLEVDMISIEKFSSEEELSKLLGIKEHSQLENVGKKINLAGIGLIADPQQLITMYPMRLSQVAEKLGFSYWYAVDKMIKELKTKTDFDIKGNNNIYHIDIGINQAEHRYSMEMIKLMQDIMSGGSYTVIVDDSGTKKKFEGDGGIPL